MHKNNKSNLVVLCKQHHDHVHQDKIIIKGWKDTSNGFVLDWENVQQEFKQKKCKYNNKELEIIKSFKTSSLPKKIILSQLKTEHNIHMSITTLNKYLFI